MLPIDIYKGAHHLQRIWINKVRFPYGTAVDETEGRGLKLVLVSWLLFNEVPAAISQLWMGNVTDILPLNSTFLMYPTRTLFFLTAIREKRGKIKHLFVDVLYDQKWKKKKNHTKKQYLLLIPELNAFSYSSKDLWKRKVPVYLLGNYRLKVLLHPQK